MVPVSIHSHGGCSSAGPCGHSNSRERKANNLYERKAYISNRKEIPTR